MQSAENRQRRTDPYRNMEKISFIAILLLGALWETAAMSVTEVSGKKITIICSHTYATSNVKYFCKGACNDADILITSRTTDHSNKYSLKDEGNTFSVTISDLTVADSGTYWCGIERVGVDTYNQVVLTVTADPNMLNETINTQSSKKMVYIGAGLAVIVLALAIFLIIFFKYRNRDVTSSKGKIQDTVYATQSNKKQDGHVTTSSTVAKEAQKTGHTSRGLTDNIYSSVNVSSEPQVQSDGLFYSTISFKRNADCRPVTPRTEGVTYSTIECKSTDTSKHVNSSVYWDDITSTKKTEASGQSVHIVCHYPKSHEKNEKFLCKGKTPFSCEKLIQTTNQERNVEKDRFKIRDNQRLNYFSVNIRFLSTDDSGTYWCGSDTTWQQAEFNKTLLTVVDKKHIKTERSVHSTFDDDDSYSEETDNDENASSGKDAVWIGIGVGGLVLLLVLLVALVLARHKLPRSQVCCPAGRSSVQVTNGGQNTEGNQGEPDYAEIQDQQASSGHVLRTVYATVNPPADQLHYATVNTHKDSLSVCTGKDALPDTNINHCDYSSVMTQSPVHPPGTERIVYSTVSMPGEP
ncbi:polymeric immunoglobulin receptor [Labrus bergylta]|uniref:polymeric immunoglobulin receptor n=1 Tax=Labrus bergylta TaxID=56723 RepID=UPI0033137A5D